MNILVVDDEDIKRITLRDDLREAGHEVWCAPSGEQGLQMLTEEMADVVVTDLRMPGMGGMKFLRQARKLRTDLYVVVMTGYGTIETAVEAIREGAYDYLTKPFSSEELLIIIRRIEELIRLRDENMALRQRLQEGEEQAAVLVGQSRKTQELRENVQRLAHTDSPVLIQGETGTGKDLVARMIHANGPRRQEPFVKVDCAIYSVNVLESELFGYEKGAFTGADNNHKGRFESAGKGTVYLDEVDDIPSELQVKLLHVLEDGVIERVGSARPIPFQARVISASKHDLKRLVAEGRFREDLFFRLNVLSLDLSPLRDCAEDLPYLIAHFLHTFGHSGDDLRFSPHAIECLKVYGWPGNVRELRNIIERLLFLAQGREITPADIPCLCTDKIGILEPRLDGSLEEQMNLFERRLLEAALREADNNQSRAAESLKMKLSTFRDHLKKHSLI